MPVAPWRNTEGARITNGRVVAVEALAHIRTLDDVALEAQYRAARGGRGLSRDPAGDRDACLTVMAERGGSHWIRFLERQYAAAKQGTRRESEVRGFRFDESVGDWASLLEAQGAGEVPAREPEPEEFVPDDPPLALALLLALRRAQLRPAPLALQIVVPEGGALASTFPDGLVLDYQLHHRDAEERTFWIGEGRGSDAFGDSSFSITVSDAAGRLAPLVPRAEYGVIRCGVESSALGAVCSAQPLHGSLQLRWFDAPPFVGSFALELAFDPDGFTWRDGASVPLEGCLAVAAPTVAVTVHPRPIELPPAERRRLRARFDAIDATEPRWIAPDSWRAELRFLGAPQSPADELFRAGWSAVPMLLDVLEEAASSPAQRAWALALLASITPLGLDGRGNRDHSLGEPAGALGSHRAFWSGYWPSIDLAAPHSQGFMLEVKGAAVPDLAIQSRLIAWWRGVRSALLVRE